MKHLCCIPLSTTPEGSCRILGFRDKSSIGFARKGLHLKLHLARYANRISISLCLARRHTATSASHNTLKPQKRNTAPRSTRWETARTNGITRISRAGSLPSTKPAINGSGAVVFVSDIVRYTEVKRSIKGTGFLPRWYFSLASSQATLKSSFLFEDIPSLKLLLPSQKEFTSSYKSFSIVTTEAPPTLQPPTSIPQPSISTFHQPNPQK